MTAKLTASADGSKILIGTAAEDALEIDATTKTVKALSPYVFEASNGVPAGTIIDFAGATPPAGYLACPLVATNISRATYAALFDAIGTAWGAGDGSTTFGMPYFPADTVGVQADANVGTQTTGVIKNHTHPTGSLASGSVGGAAWGNNAPLNAGWATATQNPTGGGANNLAAGARVRKCVKY
jgi:hypothetical protein